MIGRPLSWLVILPLLSGCSGQERGSNARESAVAGTRRAGDTAVAKPRWAFDAAKVLERQLQRELFNSRDTGYVSGARDCDEGGEEEPPPGLALVRATLAGDTVASVEEPNQAHVRALLTSVASTQHHEGGDQEEVDVDVGVRTDTIDILVEKQENGFALCYTQLFLHRGHLDWPIVRRWTPPNGSWPMVVRLADSVTRSQR